MTFIDFPIKLLDVWGEGRLVHDGIISGFEEAYNLNKWDQKTSNPGLNGKGPAGQDIPNLLSVQEYENPVFPIKDGLVNYITVMASPITEGTAQEMYRVLNKEHGVVILYDLEDQYRRTFERHARGFVYKPNDPLGKPFNEITFSPVYIYGVRGVSDHDEL